MLRLHRYLDGAFVGNGAADVLVLGAFASAQSLDFNADVRQPYQVGGGYLAFVHCQEALGGFPYHLGSEQSVVFTHLNDGAFLRLPCSVVEVFVVSLAPFKTLLSELWRVESNPTMRT